MRHLDIYKKKCLISFIPLKKHINLIHMLVLYLHFWFLNKKVLSTFFREHTNLLESGLLKMK